MTVPLYSQVEDIKNASNENKQSNSGKEYSSSSSESSGDECFSGCFDICFSSCTSLMMTLLIDQHTTLISKTDSFPEVFSIELMPHIAINPDMNHTNLLPRLRGTFGVISTEFRVNQLVEFRNITAQHYQTLSWQVLQLHIRPSDFLSARGGLGMMYESYNETVYSESLLSFDIHAIPNKLYVTLEGRNAFDYDNNMSIYSEANFRLQYRFMNSTNLSAFVMAGALYQNYYQKVDLYSLQFGLAVNIHKQLDYEMPTE